MRWLIVGLTALAIVGCDDGDSASDGGVLRFDAGDADGSVRIDAGGGEVVLPEPEPEPTGCDAADFEEHAIEFCRNQAPGAPEPRSLGARCQDDAQCDSELCVFGNECGVRCPRGDECPVGFSCQQGDRPSAESVCRPTFCNYGPTDFADCLRGISEEIDEICHQFSEPGCGDNARAWLDCLNAHGRFCSSAEAGEICGVERVRVERCCPGCSSSW